MANSDISVFQKLYGSHEFVDRFLLDSHRAVDVIIPIIHTNELWEQNLISLYREIPIARLLISDGGCVDNSVEIVKRFPRVTVFDHRHTTSLGYCIRLLIEQVKTDWFVYPHSDVYLPPGWFDKMVEYQGQYDWFGCPMRHVIAVEYPQADNARPFAGSQMGRKEAFVSGIRRIDDDFVYRQEDYVFDQIVRDAGYKSGKVYDMFHYHQTMHKISKWGRKVKDVAIEVELTQEEKVRTANTQVRGIVKYLHPDRSLANSAMFYLVQMIEAGVTTFPEFLDWVGKTNPGWTPYFSRWKVQSLLWVRKTGLLYWFQKIGRLQN